MSTAAADTATRTRTSVWSVRRAVVVAVVVAAGTTRCRRPGCAVCFDRCAVAAVLAKGGFWFMRMVPLTEWQRNSFRVSHSFEPPYDSIAVLGYAIDYKRLEPTPQLRRRLVTAAELFCAPPTATAGSAADTSAYRPVSPRPAAHLLLSGGLARQQNVTEAVVMARYLLRNYPNCFAAPDIVLPLLPADIAAAQRGHRIVSRSTRGNGSGALVPLVLENESYSTRTNAQYTMSKLLVRHLLTRPDCPPVFGAPKACPPIRLRVITNPFHQYRTFKVFERSAHDMAHAHGGVAPFVVSMHACDGDDTGDDDAAVTGGVVAAAAGSVAANDTTMGALSRPQPLLHPQKDWWREILAIAYYAVRRWI